MSRSPPAAGRGIGRQLGLAAEPGTTLTLPGWPKCTGVLAGRLHGKPTPSITEVGELLWSPDHPIC